MPQVEGSTELEKLAFSGLPGDPHPTMGDYGQCLGLGDLGCSFLSASISSAGLHFVCLSICVLITALGQGCVCVGGCRATGLLVPAGLPCHWGDMALLVTHVHPLPC